MPSTKNINSTTLQEGVLLAHTELFSIALEDTYASHSDWIHDIHACATRIPARTV